MKSGYVSRAVAALGLWLLAGVASADNPALIDEGDGTAAIPAITNEGSLFAGANPSGPLAWRLEGTTAADDRPGAAGEVGVGLPADELIVSVDSLPFHSVPSLLEPVVPNAGAHNFVSSVVSVNVGNAGSERWWQPSLNYTLQQRGSRSALYAGGGPLADEIPVERDTNHAALANWALDPWHLGVYASGSDQRQSRNGASPLVSRVRGTGFYLGLTSSDTVGIQMELGNNHVRDVALNETTRWRTGSLGLSWAPQERVGVESSLSFANSQPGSLLPALRTRSADITATYRLGGAENGDFRRLFLRLERQSLAGASTDLVIVQGSTSWGVSAGIILSAF